MNPFTTRSNVLGLPIGPRKPDWPTIVASVLVVVPIAVVLRAVSKGGGGLGATAEQLAKPLREGRELVDEGEDVIEEGAEVVQEGEHLVHEGQNLAHQAGKLGGSLSG